MDIAEFNETLRERKRLSQAKGCFIEGCTNKTIQAHSISKQKHLGSIAENGYVLTFSLDFDENGHVGFANQGKKKMSTFPGFCPLHDSIFQDVDSSDYVPGNKKQEFLFALRALAREQNARETMVKMQTELMKTLSPEMKSAYEDSFFKGFLKGFQDLNELKAAFNINLNKNRYYKIVTHTTILPKAYPIVASSVFKPEVDFKGNIINDFSTLKVIQKPIFFSIFPQNNNTVILISWLKQHDSTLSYFREIDSKPSDEQKVIFSNMLCAYVENFAIKPSHWENLPTVIRDKYMEFWGSSTTTQNNIPAILDRDLNIFV